MEGGHRERYCWVEEKGSAGGLQKRAASLGLERGYAGQRGEKGRRRSARGRCRVGQKGRAGNLKKRLISFFGGGNGGRRGAVGRESVAHLLLAPICRPACENAPGRATWLTGGPDVAEKGERLAHKGAAIVVYWLQTAMALWYRRATGPDCTAPAPCAWKKRDNCPVGRCPP